MAERRAHKERAFKILQTIVSESQQEFLVICDANYPADIYVTSGSDIWLWGNPVDHSRRNRDIMENIKKKWLGSYPMWDLRE